MKTNIKGRLGAIAIAAGSLSAFASASEFHGWVQGEGAQYAKEANPAARFDFSIDWQSTEALSPEFKKRELSAFGFYEPGKKGDWSVDLDRAAVRFKTSSSSHFTLGRIHPVEEMNPGYRSENTSAIGANWSQNQKTPLSPKVSGWVSVSERMKFGDSGVQAIATYSPVFVPHLGPRLDFSDVSSSDGARFALLPPASVKVGDAILPLRYKVDTGDLSGIVFQSQYFVSAGYHKGGIAADALFWSAPSPEPTIDASGILRVNSETVDALATAKPRFEREYFVGGRFAFSEVVTRPEVELLHEFVSNRTSVSLMDRPFSFLDVGLLHTFQRYTPPSAGEASPVSPFRKQLAWIDLHSSLGSKKQWEPSVKWEHHFTSRLSGDWVISRLAYRFFEGFSVYGYLSLLSGRSGSYFGNWRALDSFGFGLRWKW